MTIRVVIADDQGMVRAGFRSLLASEADIDVVGEASDGQTAVTQCLGLKPDVVLMDIRMPVRDGIDATQEVVQRTATRVLILTTFDLDDYVFGALRAGASGFLLKDAPAEELTNAIRAVAAGDALLAPSVTRRVVETFISQPIPRPELTQALAALTDRENEVLRLLALGLSNAAIADHLTVTEATAKTHVSNVLTKLGLRDRVQAVIFAYESGLVTVGSRLTD